MFSSTIAANDTDCLDRGLVANRIYYWNPTMYHIQNSIGQTWTSLNETPENTEVKVSYLLFDKVLQLSLQLRDLVRMA
jgi:hypothetical protein